MKTLHRYLLRQIIASLAMTVLVFTLVLLIGSALRELLPLLVNERATFGIFARAMGLLIPFVGAFSLPIGMLTATLLVFGRFSADQELTAARASGLSLLWLVWPILVFSLALCAVSAAVNLEIAPRCRVAYNHLRFSLQTALLSKIQLPAGRPIEDFPGYIIYVGQNENRRLRDISLYKLKDGTNLQWTVDAPRGVLEVDVTNEQVVLRLSNATFIDVATGQPAAMGSIPIVIKLRPPSETAGRPPISDMTFEQLTRELRRERQPIHLPPAASQMSPAELRRATRSLEGLRRSRIEEILVQIHRQAAFSFACFAFTLVGIPLGIRVHRRETNVGIAVALGLVAVYYALLILASSQAARPEWHPHLLIWLPGFVFEAVGAVLLWRANRGI